MHETTVYPTGVVLRRNVDSMCKHMLHPAAFDTVLQYFLAVCVSHVCVRSLFLTSEHPQ